VLRVTALLLCKRGRKIDKKSIRYRVNISKFSLKKEQTTVARYQDKRKNDRAEPTREVRQNCSPGGQLSKYHLKEISRKLLNQEKKKKKRREKREGLIVPFQVLLHISKAVKETKHTPAVYSIP
jgi:hypothetical protein